MAALKHMLVAAMAGLVLCAASPSTDGAAVSALDAPSAADVATLSRPQAVNVEEGTLALADASVHSHDSHDHDAHDHSSHDHGGQKKFKTCKKIRKCRIKFVRVKQYRPCKKFSVRSLTTEDGSLPSADGVQAEEMQMDAVDSSVRKTIKPKRAYFCLKKQRICKIERVCFFVYK